MDEPPRYPIRAVSKLTGVPVDTLRAWERRYGVVQPVRDSRGRLYGDTDVRKLRLLRLLVDRGHPIGRLVKLSEKELVRLQTQLEEPAAPAGRAGADLETLLLAVERFDGAAADRELRRLAALYPPRQLVRQVVLPLMRRVGEVWFEGRLGIAQEHLASGVLRNLLGSMLRVHAPEEPRLSLLFATPPGERHEFGILAGAMLAAAGGLGAVYLGLDLPGAEIAAGARRGAVRAVVLGIIGASGAAGAAASVGEVAAALPRGVELWVGGPRNSEIEQAVARAGGIYVPDFEAYEEHLLRLGARF
jgi:DNA-binding transcriptional MerR regulator/methylmalonyl-CoA mutase cobalamin-binding subunit